MSGTADDPIFVYFGDILVKSEDDNGNLIVSGKAAGPDLDLDRQILDPDWLASAMPEWFDTGGNIRLQHDMHKPVGKATTLTEKADGHWITAKIVDPEAQKLVREEVLTGFSVGIKNPRVDMSTKALTKAPGGIVKGGAVIETSIVDRACNSACVLTLAKAAGPDATPVLPDGVEPQTDKGLVRTEEIRKATTTGGHIHEHTHEDGSHTHAHAHSPLPGHHDHDGEDSPPHSHAHDPKDSPRVDAPAGDEPPDDGSGSEGGDGDGGGTTDDASKAARHEPPKLDGGPQSAAELHKAAMAKLAARGIVVDVAKAPEATAPAPETTETPTLPVPGPTATAPAETAKEASPSITVAGNVLSLEQLQAMISSAVEKATSGDTDPAKPHAFVGDGKTCEACGKARDEGMHKKDFGGNGKAAAPALVKKDYTTETRIAMAKKGQALPIRNDKGEITGGRYPIADGGDLTDAISSFGRGKDSDADDVKAFIKKRAKALGMSDKIPDEWKVADYDAAKALLSDKGLLTKELDGDTGKPDHTEAYAQACAGLSQLIQNEAQELAAGDDEYWSLSCLLQAVSGLRSWRMGEVKEGEMDPVDLNRPTYDYMAATADLVKAIGGMPALIASEVAKALRPEPVAPKTAIVTVEGDDVDTDKLAASFSAALAEAMKPVTQSIEALTGKMATTEATVEKIAKAPQANGPRRLGAVRTPVPLPGNEHRDKAAYLRAQADLTSNHTMREGYMALAADEEAKAADLEKRAEAAG